MKSYFMAGVAGVMGVLVSSAWANTPCEREGLADKNLHCKLTYAYAERSTTLTLAPAPFQDVSDEPWETPDACAAQISFKDPVTGIRANAHWNTRSSTSGKLSMYFQTHDEQLASPTFSATPAPCTEVEAIYSLKPAVQDARGQSVYMLRFSCLVLRGRPHPLPVPPR